jgi:RNA polymerase sigma-70 factor (ECF subfamily)
MSAVAELTDAELLLKVAEGNPDALALLYDRHAPLVYSITYQRIGAEAAPILIDTFYELWHEVGQGRYVPSVVTYLLREARARSYRYLVEQTSLAHV